MSGWRAERVGKGPIVVPHMDERMGANVNGPSLVRVPDWVAEPLGRYYLYFAHHNGSYIRLAYADDLAGPWRIHTPGTLQHSSSYFPTELDPVDASRIPAGFVLPKPHIASPDVHVDGEERRFRMYFHGILADRRQVTRMATSRDGIHFTANERVLGRSYWRGFGHGGLHYGLAMPGVFYRSRDPSGPYEEGPTLFSKDMRHAAVLVEGNFLHVFYTNVGEAPPEKILATTIDLSPDWMAWQTGMVATVLEPEHAYEGADLPLQPSVRGEITARARQLRDPALFRDGNDLYLLYSLAGESGIGLARLHRRT